MEPSCDVTTGDSTRPEGGGGVRGEVVQGVLYTLRELGESQAEASSELETTDDELRCCTMCAGLGEGGGGCRAAG